MIWRIWQWIKLTSYYLAQFQQQQKCGSFSKLTKVFCVVEKFHYNKKPNRASEWVLEIFWSLVWTQTDDRTKRNEQRIDLLFYMYINSHQIIKAAFVVSFYSMACSSWLKCDEPASVLFLEAMTHFSFGNLYMMNVWDTLCMYAHTRHRCRMNIFFC